MVKFFCCLIKMNEIIVYLVFIAFVMYFNSNVIELFTGKDIQYGYRDFLCNLRKSDNCNSIVNINQRSLSMSPGNLRKKLFYDF
jgi:hypothetical protein